MNADKLYDLIQEAAVAAEDAVNAAYRMDAPREMIDQIYDGYAALQKAESFFWSLGLDR